MSSAARFARSLPGAGSQRLAGALACALLLVGFFWKPIVLCREVTYSSADLTQDFSLTRVAPGYTPKNRLLSDAVTEVQPWCMFNRSELAAGRFPLWNPWNGAGRPHFANYQSGVLSPFGLPFYLMRFKAALLLSAFLKLFALGLFTFLFLKELGLRFLPALVGGAAFMFAGHNLLLLSLPHVGALVALPAGLFCAERAFRRFVRDRGEARLFLPLAGVTLALLGGLLAGNPEPFYFALLCLGAYCAARILALARAHGARPAAVLAGKLTAAGALAAGFAAVQLLPFFEYVAESVLLDQRSAAQTPLDPRFWPLALFPNALGNPATPYNLSYEIPPPNFEQVNLAYVGGPVVLLALLSLCFARRDRRVLFFALAGGAWSFYAYDLLGAASAFALLPTLDMAPMNRSQGVFAFCLAVNAALGLDHLLARSGGPRWRMALGTLLGGGALLGAAWIGAGRLAKAFATAPGPERERFLEYVPGHLAAMSAGFLLALAALALLWVVRAERSRVLAALLVLAAVLHAGGWLLRGYGPVTEDRLFFPETDAIRALKARVGPERLAILGEDGLPPDTNQVYGIAQLANYDGLWIRDFDVLYRVMFGDTHNWRPIVRGTERALQLFGVQWVLAEWDWLFVDSGLRDIALEPGQRWVPREILPGAELSQTFVCEQSGLQAVMLMLGALPGSPPSTLRLELHDVETGALIGERVLSCAEIAADVRDQVRFELDPELGPPGRPVLLTFARQADSQGKSYRLTAASDDAVPGNAVGAWSAARRTYAQGEARQGAAALAGELLFDYSGNLDAFERVEGLGHYGLYRLRSSLGRYWVVRGAITARTEPEAIGLLCGSSFDPAALVVLGPEDPPDPSPDEIGEIGGTGAEPAAAARLVKTADSVKVYFVGPDGRSIVHIQDKATFLANGFRWDQIETISAEEFARFTVVRADLELERRAGLRMVEEAAGDEPPPRIVSETPTRTRIEVERAEPGYLVIAQARYPGWRARVNDAEARLLRANYAFSAVELAPGLNVVDHYYDPASLRAGLWILLGSALASMLAAWRALRAARQQG